MAERTGFEPAEAVNLARFPSVCLKPLDHLSMRFNGSFAFCLNRITNFAKIVNYILRFKQNFAEYALTAAKLLKRASYTKTEKQKQNYTPQRGKKH